MSQERERFDVVLVQPGVLWVYDPYEHLGLAYLAASLRQQGLSVKIVDAVLLRLRMSALYEELQRYEIGVLGVTLVSHGYPEVERFLQEFHAQSPETRIVAGGHFATFAADKIFAHTDVFDAIVLGEGDVSFVDYCLAAVAGIEEPVVANVALAGHPVRRQHVRIDDLDALPFPARDMLPLAVERGAIASITASRGCYARCSFCTVSQFYEAENGPRWLSRSIDDILEELAELQDRFRMKHFMFVDDNFMGPGKKGQQRALEFADAYGRSGLDMSFHIDMRAVDVYEDVIRALVDVGMTSIFIGIESVAKDDLIFYRKDLDPEANWRAVEIIKQFDLERTLAMIMFNPITSPRTIVDNCRFLRIAEFYPRNPITILNIYEGTEHARLYADRVSGPFWDYHFEFENQGTRAIYDAALAFCSDSLPLERTMLKQVSTTSPECQELYRMRLGCLEDLALDEGANVDETLKLWRNRLEVFGEQFGGLEIDDSDLLYLPASTPPLPRPAVVVSD